MTPAHSSPAPLFSSSGNLRLVATCPFCSTHFNVTAATVLAERDDAHVLHLECRHCGSSVVALVLTGGVGVSSIGLVTDLTSDDVVKFSGRESISLDDVLELHASLTDSGGFLQAVATNTTSSH